MKDLDVDIQTIYTTPDDDNEQMELVAKIAAQALTNHYPNHLWMVGWAPGKTLVIKNMAIDDGRYGFTVDASKAATIEELEQKVVFGGGELLERCNARRGAWNGEILHLSDKR